MPTYNLRFSLTSSNSEFTSTTGYVKIDGDVEDGTFTGTIPTSGEWTGLFSSSGAGGNTITTNILNVDYTTAITITNFPTTSASSYTNLPVGSVVTLVSSFADPDSESTYNLFTNPGLMVTTVSGIGHWRFYNDTEIGNVIYYYLASDPETAVEAENVTFSFTSVAGPSPTSPACFMEGTKLLAHVKDKDTYVNIEDLRAGDLVKTHLHGYKSIKLIGKGFMTNNPDKWNGCVKKLPKSGDMTDDLFVTGAHSILVDELSEKEAEGMVSIYGTADRKIDDKTLVLSWVSEKFEAVDDNKDYTYYHLVLEHDDDEMKRYGIWANGVLTESQCEKHFLGKDYELL
jgi:hypothetical protein